MIKSIWIVLVCIMVLITPSLSHASKTHRVKKHESLYSLAKKYHVPVAELKKANNLMSAHIKAGAVLVIPPRSASAGADERVKNVRLKGDSYKVKRGDTFIGIARKTGVSVKELKRLNAMGKGRLRPGRVLALRANDTADEPKPRLAKRIMLRNSDLFNEKDYEQSLAELTETEPAPQVDLSKNLELKTDNVKMLKTKAYGFLGTHYRFGGSSSKGIDCSAFVQQVFREMAVSLPRTAREQFDVGHEVSPGDLQKGDLVFFRTYASYPSHVGIYLGESKMIHASSRDRRVVISTMNTPYYRARFIGAKRISKINPETFRFDDLINGIEEETVDEAPKNDSLNVGLN